MYIEFTYIQIYMGYTIQIYVFWFLLEFFFIFSILTVIKEVFRKVYHLRYFDLLCNIVHYMPYRNANKTLHFIFRYILLQCFHQGYRLSIEYHLKSISLTKLSLFKKKNKIKEVNLFINISICIYNLFVCI